MRTSAFYALAVGQLAAAHTTFQSFVVNGKDQGQHFAIRTPSNGNNPIKDVSSPSLNCNGGVATTGQVEIAAGGEVTLQWHHNDPKTESGDADEPIAASHHGPVMVYISDAKANGEGAVWQKIYEDGLSGGVWGVDKFIANKGAITINIPNLKAGDYLIRPEILALHEASAPGMTQFYNGCGQITVTGSGSLSLPATGTDMTKAYSATDPGVLVNIYPFPATYSIPGPPVWDGAGSTDAPVAASSAASSAAAVVTPPASSAAAVPTKASTSAAAVVTPIASAVSSKAAPVASKSTAAGYPVASTIIKTTAAPPAAASSTVAAAAPAASSSTVPAGNGAKLPEKFTIQEFISWLEATTGSAAARRFARSLSRKHARAF